MARVLFLLLTLFLSSHVMASDFIKVLKVKGRKAVVKLPDTNFEKGQNIRVDRGVWNQNQALNGRRKYRTDFDIFLGSVDTKEETSSTTRDSSSSNFSVNSRFGFNKKQYEYGPIFSYSRSSSEDSKSSSFAAGGFFEYNFRRNEKGEILIPYLGLDLSFGSGSTETSGSEDVGSSTLSYGFYGGVRYMPANDHFFLNGGLQYRISTEEEDDDNETKTTTTQLGLYAGFGVYF